MFGNHRRVRRARGLGRVALIPLVVGALGCATWSKTREEVIDPIHALLHHAYPDALAEMNRAELGALFVGGLESPAVAPSLALLAGFSELEDVRAIIDTVKLEELPITARVHVNASGVGLEEELRSIQQDKEFTLERTDAGWRITGDRETPIRVVPTPTSHFVDEAALRGLWFEHVGRDMVDPKGEPHRFIYASGAAAIDVDDDGWDDVVLLGGDRIELFLNRRGYFTSESLAWGLGVQDETAGVLTIALPLDYDDDGRTDLFVGAEMGQPLLFRNEGDRFVRVANTGIQTEARTISASAADFDGDGWVDLFLANHDDVFRNAPNLPNADNAFPDQLFLNNGDGTFRDVTDDAGVANTGWSLSPVAADYDLDGDVDLFVGNDFGDDKLYRNDGSAHFEDVARDVGVYMPVASMSADWGDFDADGDLDLFVGGMASGSAWVLEVPDFRVRSVPRLLDWMFRPYVREAVRAWFRGNRFYENMGDGTFREFSEGSGAANNGWSWGSVFLDFDNDGRLDVYGANGFISGPVKDDL